MKELISLSVNEEICYRLVLDGKYFMVSKNGHFTYSTKSYRRATQHLFEEIDNLITL